MICMLITGGLQPLSCPWSAGTLQDLAKFYQKNGQRARITADQGEKMLEGLKLAKTSLDKLSQGNAS